MGNGPPTAASRSLTRLLLWEGMGLLGFLHILRHPLADPLWALNYRYNALFFLAAYPLLYVYRWTMMGGCLGMILFPLSFVLSLGLGACAYIWVLYSLLFSASPYYHAATRHGWVLGPLFIALVYFPLVEPLWGVSRKYHSLGQWGRIFVFAAVGGFLGYLLGWAVQGKLHGLLASDNLVFLAWLTLIGAGTALGSYAARWME